MRFSISKFSHASAISLGLSLMAFGFQAQADECKPVHNFKTVTPGVLTVTLDTSPPFGWVEPGNLYKGVEADVLKKFAEQECLKISPMPVPAASAIQYIVSNRADVSQNGWFVTRDRAKVMNYINPLYVDRNAIYSKQGWSKLSELEGKKVGTVQGFLFVSELQKIFGRDLILYPSVTAVIQDLNSGRLDAAMVTTLIGASLQQQNAIPGIKIEVLAPDERVASSIEAAQIGMLYGKNNTALGEALNSTLADMVKDGQVEAIVKKYNMTKDDINTAPLRYIQ